MILCHKYQDFRSELSLKLQLQQLLQLQQGFYWRRWRRRQLDAKDLTPSRKECNGIQYSIAENRVFRVTKWSLFRGELTNRIEGGKLLRGLGEG
jgi:hypothetical protein